MCRQIDFGRWGVAGFFWLVLFTTIGPLPKGWGVETGSSADLANTGLAPHQARVDALNKAANDAQDQADQAGNDQDKKDYQEKADMLRDIAKQQAANQSSLQNGVESVANQEARNSSSQVPDSTNPAASINQPYTRVADYSQQLNQWASNGPGNVYDYSQYNGTENWSRQYAEGEYANNPSAAGPGDFPASAAERGAGGDPSSVSGDPGSVSPAPASSAAAANGAQGSDVADTVSLPRSSAGSDSLPSGSATAPSAQDQLQAFAGQSVQDFANMSRADQFQTLKDYNNAINQTSPEQRGATGALEDWNAKYRSLTGSMTDDQQDALAKQVLSQDGMSTQMAYNIIASKAGPDGAAAALSSASQNYADPGNLQPFTNTMMEVFHGGPVDPADMAALNHALQQPPATPNSGSSISSQLWNLIGQQALN